MADRKVFHNSITPLLTEKGLTPQGMMVQPAKPEHRKERMNLAFSLGMSDQAKATLEATVAAGKKVAPSELPKPADSTALVSWLKDQGFAIKPSKAGTSVFASATVDQIEKALQVNMVRVTKGGLS